MKKLRLLFLILVILTACTTTISKEAYMNEIDAMSDLYEDLVFELQHQQSHYFESIDQGIDMLALEAFKENVAEFKLDLSQFKKLNPPQELNKFHNLYTNGLTEAFKMFDQGIQFLTTFDDENSTKMIEHMNFASEDEAFIKVLKEQQ